MEPCSCIDLSSSLRAQLSYLANALHSLRSNFNLPSTDSGMISHNSSNGNVNNDNEFNDNITGAFYLMIFIMSVFIMGRIFKNYTRQRNMQSSNAK